jgi:hypothetical protein
MKRLQFFETSGTTRPVTQRHNPATLASLAKYYLIQLQPWPHKTEIPRKEWKISNNYFHIMLPATLFQAGTLKV